MIILINIEFVSPLPHVKMNEIRSLDKETSFYYDSYRTYAITGEMGLAHFRKMTFDEELKLERYKVVTARQKYFTDLAQGAFTSYSKAFASLVAGGIALISAKSKLELEPELLNSLLNAILYLVAFLGVVAIGQIIFCLARWKGYREDEIDINPDSPPIKWWWWIFETLYCIAITVSIVAIWMISPAG